VVAVQQFGHHGFHRKQDGANDGDGQTADQRRAADRVVWVSMD
jgi:hypothetical protein